MTAPRALPLPDEQPVTVNALRNKRAEILGKIEMHEREANRLRGELVHLDATLRLFDPMTDPEAIGGKLLKMPRRTEYFAKGETTRLIYECLRERGIASAKDVAEHAATAKGIEVMGNPATEPDFIRRFLDQLHDMKRKGKVVQVGQRKGARWKVAAGEPDLL